MADPKVKAQLARGVMTRTEAIERDRQAVQAVMDKPAKKKPAAPSRMNGEETAYARQLDIMKRMGLITDYKFEPVRLRLADATTYTPDFMVVTKTGGVAFYEVKAYWKSARRVGWREDARVKIKVAQEMYPHWSFVATWRRDGHWEEERFGA